MRFRSFSKFKKSRQGFSLTELAIYMGITGIVLGAVWAAASAVQQNMYLSRTQQQIAMIVQNVRKMYAQTNSFAAGTTNVTTNLAEADIFPSETIDPAAPTQPRTVWSTDYYIWLTGSSREFAVGLNGPIPREICRGLMVRFLGRDDSSGLKRIITGCSGGCTGANDFDASEIANLSASSSGIEDCESIRFIFNLK